MIEVLRYRYIYIYLFMPLVIANFFYLITIITSRRNWSHEESVVAVQHFALLRLSVFCGLFMRPSCDRGIGRAWGPRYYPASASLLDK